MSVGPIRRFVQSIKLGETSAPAGGTPADPIIQVEDVSVRFGTVSALSDVDMSVDSGEFIGLVGPNGSGKTTLVRTIAGVLSPDSGSIRVRGNRVDRTASRAVSRDIAVVPQDTSLTFDFSVRDVVAMGRTPYLSRLGRSQRSDRDAVRRAIKRTAVEDLADRSINEVSGGERQRVLIARALAQETPVLLLDEPTASLDINHQIRTLELVAELATEGKTVVAAIHDLNLAAHYCDELVLLGDGRRIAAGPPKDVLTEEHLEEVFGTRAVVTRHPVTGSTLVMALPDRPSMDTRGRVHVIGGGGSAARILYLLSAAGFEVSVGALNHGDADLETANMLGIDTVTVDPFGPVTDQAKQAVESKIDAADLTVITDIEVGEGNLPNLQAAARADDLVIVEERAFSERNFAGAAARELYSDLRQRAALVSPDSLIRHITDRVADTDTGESTTRRQTDSSRANESG